jgi:hypothetical protein
MVENVCREQVKVKLRRNCTEHCGKWRQIPATAGDKGRQMAATFHRSLRQIAASSLPPFAATCRVLSGRVFSFQTWKGMVSNKINGFPIPESRHKSRSIERMKWDDAWSH